MGLTQANGYVTAATGAWIAGWTIQPAQFNADALPHLFLFNPTSRQWCRLLTNGAPRVTEQATGGRWPGCQRYVLSLDGDGLSDVFPYDPGAAQYYTCVTTPTWFTYTT